MKLFLVNLLYFCTFIWRCQGVCDFDRRCDCTNEVGSGRVVATCPNIGTTFPTFKQNNDVIDMITISGKYTVVYDDAFNLFFGMKNSTIDLTSVNPGDDLITYDNTFLTPSPDGVGRLIFDGFNLVNLTTMTNVQYVHGLGILTASLKTVPTEIISHFPSLA